MQLSDFSYDLPPERIAQHPLPHRDASRLMVLHRGTQTIEHRLFPSVCEYLHPQDLLVLNDTRVIPCRLFGQKQTGGRLEIFFLKAVADNRWEVLIRGNLKVNDSFLIAQGALTGRVVEKKGQGRCIASFSGEMTIDQVLEEYGQVPLPPYINHFQSPTTEDRDRYQTVFARQKGAVAAPTAGLHFTDSLLDAIRNQGVQIAFVTLHVGLGTFQPVKAENIEEHRMEAEYYEVPEDTLRKITETKEKGGRIIACGTTSTRVLESLGQNPDLPRQGWTDLFIYPGFTVRMVDSLITNFHLPKSTLLMLVAAFAGRDFVLEAYRQAVAREYRFYSYGDAMLIL
ncbi:MAG: tRNA preQ1(34) S-adenosylmethionine ribosyltransferase-isomerase QueA [bacterium]